MRLYTRFWRKLCVISSLLEIFRRLIAISIAFYTPNAMHAVFSADSSPTVRKMRPYTRFWWKLCGISVLLEIFRRLKLFPSHFTHRMLCTPDSSSKQARLFAKCDHVLDFDDKLCVISVLLEIFRRLIAISIAFYTPNDMHASIIVET